MIVDLFAGPGGWDEGLKLLGRHKDCIGIEWDEAACQTAHAAGHSRDQADIAALDPVEWASGHVCEGLIASPPCQSFSTAGKQKGRADKEHIIACAHELAAGFDSRHQYEHLLADERSLLTVEPLRWALALKPRWIAFEQVPAVLELWTLFAGLLAEHGYQSAVGTLSAEQYGVPQTRKRAFLVASLDGSVSLPEPTHSKYYGRDPKRLDEGVLPWVSMAQALGWDEGLTVNTRGNRKTSGGNEFDADTPSRALTEKARSWKVRTDNFSAVARDDNGARSKAGSVPYERDVDVPAPTLTGTAQRWTFERPAPTIVTTRRSRDGIPVGRQLPPGEGENVGGKNWVDGRPESTAALQVDDWPHHRPATTIAGDARVFQPGGHHTSGSQSQNAVRVTTEEATILMGFRLDYPWQGSRSKQFQQIGNAVCPPLGARVLAEAMRLPVDVDVAA